MIEGPPLTDQELMTWVGDYAQIGAEQCPGRLAFISAETGESVTYREFDRRVSRAILLLGQHGISSGDCIAYLGRNASLFYVLLIASIRAGFILAPLNWRSKAPEIQHFLNDSKALLLFCDADFLEAAEQAASHLKLSPRMYLTAPLAGHDSAFVDALVQDGTIATRATPHGQTTCLLFYTSGTSGLPKGVPCSHTSLSLMRYAELISPEFPKWSGETIIAGMPSFHVGGLCWTLIGLARQSTCVLTANPTAANFIRLFREYEATAAFAIPTVIRDIVDEVRRMNISLPALKTLFYGAMPIGETLLRDAIDTLKCSFGQFYGMTEIGGSATFLAPCDHDLARPALMQSVGRPYPGVAIEIRDPSGQPVAPGVHGEIYVRTPSVMQSYWNRPEATKEAISPDGWYRTGDGGRLDDQGFLYLTDRIKDMIVTGGENVYPAEIEEVLLKHPAVRAAAVVAQPDSRWGEIVAAIVETVPGQTVAEEELIAYVRTQIAGYKCPKAIQFVESLPRTASGKIQRTQAKKNYLESLRIAQHAESGA